MNQQFPHATQRSQMARAVHAWLHRQVVVRWSRAMWSNAKPWVAALFMVLTANLFSGGIKDIIDALVNAGNKPVAWDIILIPTSMYFLFCVGSVCWLYRLRKHFFYPRTRLLKSEDEDQLEQREHLILFLSTLGPHTKDFQGALHQGGVELTGNLEQDLAYMAQLKLSDPKKPRWQWEQPLRGIWHHAKTKGKLKSITLICSEDSMLQVHWFGSILREKYQSVFADVQIGVLKKGLNVAELVKCPEQQEQPKKEGGWGFEDFDDLSRALLSLLEMFKHQGVTDHKIMIDLTGGQKPTSVVAAAVTFNRDIKVQYVQTNFPWHVIGYDVLLTSTLTEGTGW